MLESCRRYIQICHGGERRWDGFGEAIPETETKSSGRKKRKTPKKKKVKVPIEAEIERSLCYSESLRHKRRPLIELAVYELTSETEGWYPIAACQWLEKTQPAPEGKAWRIKQHLYIPLCLEVLLKDGVTVINIPLPVPVSKKPEPQHHALWRAATARTCIDSPILSVDFSINNMERTKKDLGKFWNNFSIQETGIRESLKWKSYPKVSTLPTPPNTPQRQYHPPSLNSSRGVVKKRKEHLTRLPGFPTYTPHPQRLHPYLVRNSEGVVATQRLKLRVGKPASLPLSSPKIAPEGQGLHPYLPETQSPQRMITLKWKSKGTPSTTIQTSGQQNSQMNSPYEKPLSRLPVSALWPVYPVPEPQVEHSYKTRRATHATVSPPLRY